MIKNMKQIIEKNIHSPTTALESCICIIFSVPFVFHKCTQKLLTSVLFHNYDFNLYEKFDPSNSLCFCTKKQMEFSTCTFKMLIFKLLVFFPFAIFHQMQIYVSVHASINKRRQFVEECKNYNDALFKFEIMIIMQTSAL